MSPIVQATLKSKVGGEVELMPLREGQDVREGEVLARIDTRNLQAQYDRQLAAVERARADLDLATLNRDKNRTLLEKHYISQNTYEATESAYAGMVANVKLAEADARLAKINLEDAVVRAPFAGTIAKRHVQPGEKVSLDSTIVTLVDLRQMVLEAAVPAADIPAVGIGQPARFKVGGFGAREFVGEVQRINPITADGSRAITIYIAVPNPNNALKGGMFAQGALTLDKSEPVLAVPQRAVHEEAGAAYVYMLRDEKVVRTTVKVGATAPGSSLIEVREGLAAGDRVIVTEITAAQVGQRVVVRNDPVSGCRRRINRQSLIANRCISYVDHAHQHQPARLRDHGHARAGRARPVLLSAAAGRGDARDQHAGGVHHGGVSGRLAGGDRGRDHQADRERHQLDRRRAQHLRDGA